MRKLLLALCATMAGVLFVGTPAHAAQPTKVLFVIGENTGYAKAFSSMPYLKSLANNYGSATNLKDSLPTCNSGGHYILEAFGSNFGVCDDNNPSAHPINHPSVYGDAIRNGRTARVFVQSAKGNCALVNQGPSKVRHHGGWPYSVYLNERSLCQQFVTPMETTFQTAINNGLANINYLAPDDNHNAHNPSTPRDWDNFLNLWLPKVMAGPDYRAGNLVIVISTDEGDSNNILPFVVVHPSLNGKVVSTALTQFDIYRMFENYAGNSNNSNALTGFGL